MQSISYNGHTITTQGRFDEALRCWTVTLYITPDGERAPSVIICTERVFTRKEEAEGYGLEVAKKWVDEKRGATVSERQRQSEQRAPTRPGSSRWRSL